MIPTELKQLEAHAREMAGLPDDWRIITFAAVDLIMPDYSIREGNSGYEVKLSNGIHGAAPQRVSMFQEEHQAWLAEKELVTKPAISLHVHDDMLMKSASGTSAEG